MHPQGTNKIIKQTNHVKNPLSATFFLFLFGNQKDGMENTANCGH